MRNTLLIAFVIVMLAVVCRTPWALQPRTVRWDEPDYLILARNLRRGDGYQVFGVPEIMTPPAVPLLAAAALAAGAPEDGALAVWQVLAGAMLCGLLYGLSYEVTGSRRIAVLAGVLAAVSPALAVWPLYWGSVTESVFIAFLLAGLWATWRLLTRPGWRPGAAAGFAFALAYLSRPEGMIWWAMYLVLVLAIVLWRRRPWLPLLAFVLAFLVVAAPYWAYLSRQSGRLLVSGKTDITLSLGMRITEQGSGQGNDYAAALDSTGSEIMWLSPERFDASLLNALRTDPNGFAHRLYLNLAKVPLALLNPLLGMLALALIVLGLLGRFWDCRRARAEAFWISALLPLAAIPLFHTQPRLLVPLVPLALVWVSRGAWHAIDWGEVLANLWPRVKWLGKVWAVLVIAVVLLSGVWGEFNAARAGQADLVPSHQAAGRWLREHAELGAPVMTRNSEVALYADRPDVPFPNATWEEVLAYARAHGVRYVVTDSWELAQLRPQLAALGDPATAPPELQYLATFSDPRRTTLVYRLTR